MTPLVAPPISDGLHAVLGVLYAQDRTVTIPADKPMTIRMIAERAGVSTDTAGVHLNRLETRKWVVRTYTRQPGRGARLYCLTAAARRSNRFLHLTDSPPPARIPSLTPTVRQILRSLQAGPMSVRQLADRMGAPKSTVFSTLRNLPSSVVTRTPSDLQPLSRKGHSWSLTEAGRRGGYEVLIADPDTRKVLAAVAAGPASVEELAVRADLVSDQVLPLLDRLGRTRFVARASHTPEVWCLTNDEDDWCMPAGS